MGFKYKPFFLKSKKLNKYRAVRTNGMGSKLEAAVFQILQLREKAGEIIDIKQQTSVDLGFGINWKVDFSFIDLKTKNRVYCEAKGMETERYRICKKLWKGGQGPGRLEIYKGSYKNPTMVEVIIPKERDVE